LGEKHGVPAGYEVAPTGDARALVAYLLSLKADVPLFAAPMTVAGAVEPGTVQTNVSITNPAAPGVIPNTVVSNAPAPTNSSSGSNAPPSTNVPAK
jgi:hypothetical protein